MEQRQSELKANKVYISPVLQELYPEVYNDLMYIFKKHNVNHDVLWGKSQNNRPRDIWARDFMPVQTDKCYVWFKYSPDSLLPEEQERGLTTIEDIDITALNIPDLNNNLIMEQIIAEGGNFVKSDDYTFVCEKIFKDNPNYSTIDLFNKLTSYFGRVIIIPQMPEETIGHADGYIRYVGNNTVVVNSWIWKDKYGEHNVSEYRIFICTLLNFGLKVVELPNKWDAEDMYSDYGDYGNYLVVDKLVVMQRYGIDEDEKALQLLKSLFPEDYSFESIDCTKISKAGGALNCCTWTITI